MLTGRNAIITGASRGLGRAVAEAFLQRGASVLLCARDGAALTETAAELQKAKRDTAQKILCIAADIAEEADVDAIFSRTQEAFDRLDALVNNAGVHGPIGPIEDADWDKWKYAVAVNLFGTANMLRHALSTMKQQGYGRIVNLSGGGATSPMPNFSAYAASKAAVVRITETFAKEAAPFGVTVNAVAPGMMDTKLLSEVLAAGPEKAGAAQYEKAAQNRQSGACADPAQAAALIALLCSPDCPVNGRLVSAVWDGWKAFDARREEIAESDLFTLRRIVPKDRGRNWE